MRLYTRRHILTTSLLLAFTLPASLAFANSLATSSPPEHKTPVATGYGGAAATISAPATQAAMQILNKGGNAIDAAVAAAATLGVTDPFSCGIGGGGFMLIYLAKEKRFITIDHRETAPANFTPAVFMENGKEIDFTSAVNSGMSVGIPGTVRGWHEALTRYGSMQFKQVLAPAIQTAEKGFAITPIFHHLNAGSERKFSLFSSSAALYLKDGKALPVGSHFRNPDLAKAYRELASGGLNAFYQGAIGNAVLKTVNTPPTAQGVQVRAGQMNAADLKNYEVRLRLPVHSTYRGYDVYGLGVPSSGGITIAEALNILEGFDTKKLPREQVEHLYLEAVRLAFADRNAYLADPEFTDVPVQGLLSKDYAKERRQLISLEASASRESESAASDPFLYQNDLSHALRPETKNPTLREDGKHTTHLTVSDKEGNIVSYTYTIEDWGGNGMVVPGYGFLLNNEMTDFDFSGPRPNIPEAGKRPRSSMSPTIVLKNGKPAFTVGSPGGATIITTVLQTIVNYLDLGMSMEQAIAAPRLSERNQNFTQVEPGFIGSAQAQSLSHFGHQWEEAEDYDKEIGAANALVFNEDGSVTAVSEIKRHGIGSALVQKKSH
jgi:gamma-glutamyltranspeptidase/glutathione hydrolase